MMFPKFFQIVAVALAGLLALAACSSDGESDEASSNPDDETAENTALDEEALDEEEADEEATTEVVATECAATADEEDEPAAAADKPTVEVPDGEEPTELVVVDLVEGDGAEAQPGDLVKAHYVGVLFEDGTEFDSSWDRGEAFQFGLGAGQVIAGWDEGIAGMKVGGQRMLVIPPDLAYGEAGGGELIGPNASLVFVVDLVDVRPLPDEPEVEIPDESTGELEVEDVIEGDGAEVGPGCLVTLHYVLALESTGEVAQSSWIGAPVTVPIGDGTVIPGWDEGLVGAKEGGRRVLVVPPELAFGEQGNGPVPPDETLVFVIDVLEVS